MGAPDVSFREGTTADLAPTFALGQRALHAAAVRQGVARPGTEIADSELDESWRRGRRLLEFLAAQDGMRCWVAEQGGELVGFARVVHFGQLEELTELMVEAGHRDRGIGRTLLERCWPGDPTRDLGRVAVAVGTPDNLSLYTEFGIMPIAGHWHLWQPTQSYVEQRSHELDCIDPAVSVLKPVHAAEEWKRLEPAAIGHDRSLLHDFFGRDRVCLAAMDLEAGRARSVCWVSNDGEIGPAVGATPADLVPVVLAALDRVAHVHEPEHLRVFCTTVSWWLLRRLRGLGFQVFWPGWLMCSVPLPGLDRYMPTMPPQLL